ncbi:MAG: hypothetical protein IKR84_05250 [Oscillibacter sp.]|nr:hypothetical protein [Oscillibacter sp.]
MFTDELYEAAFRYKKTKLWKQMFDSELFAVRLSDGEIGYCCVMGLAGEHIALAVYVGDEGFQSYRELAFRDDDEWSDDFSSMPDVTWMFRQSCLQCSFENKNELDYDEFMTARDYAQSHKIRQRGAHAWPHFTKCARYRIPTGLETPEDERRLTEGLLAGEALYEILQKKSKSDIGLFPIDEDTERIPLLIPDESGYVVSSTPVPPEWAETFPEPAQPDAEKISELLKLRKRGVYDCELIRLPGLLDGQADAEDAPYFPALLLCADTKTERQIVTKAVTDYDTRPESLRDEFLRALVDSGECPRAIRARNEQTRALLSNLCMEGHILFSVEENLPGLDNAREQVLGMLRKTGGAPWDDDEDEDDGDEIDIEAALAEAVDDLMNMSDAELKRLPPMMIRQVLEMANFGFVPQELQLRLRRLFKNL